MTEQKKYEQIWEEIIDDLYEQNEQFNYIKVKKIYKRINIYKTKVDRKIKEIDTTINLSDFNENEHIKNDLICFKDYLLNMSEYLENFVCLEPKTKKGYYNYLKNCLSFF